MMLKRYWTRFGNWAAGKSRELIVNADDFGMSPFVNAGIINAHQHGIVTSASLMVRREAAAQAATFASRHPGLSVGLHVDLGEWICREQQWVPVYTVVDLEDRDTVAREIWRQVEVFRRLTQHDPTHLDSHQHVHQEEPVRSAMLSIAAELGSPLRHFSAVQYCGQFYGQEKYGEPTTHDIAPTALIGLLDGLPTGITELCCHPAAAVQPNDQYGRERPVELETLCDPAVRRALEHGGIRLRSFHGLTTNAPRVPEVAAV